MFNMKEQFFTNSVGFTEFFFERGRMSITAVREDCFIKLQDYFSHGLFMAEKWMNLIQKRREFPRCHSPSNLRTSVRIMKGTEIKRTPKPFCYPIKDWVTGIIAMKERFINILTLRLISIDSYTRFSINKSCNIGKIFLIGLYTRFDIFYFLKMLMSYFVMRFFFIPANSNQPIFFGRRGIKKLHGPFCIFPFFYQEGNEVGNKISQESSTYTPRVHYLVMRRVFVGLCNRSSKFGFKVIKNTGVSRRNNQGSPVFIIAFSNIETSISINITGQIWDQKLIIHINMISRFKLKSNRKLDNPSEISRRDVDNIERILLGNDARPMLESIDAMDKFGTGPIRDAFIGLASTDITSDLQRVSGVKLKNEYPSQEGLRPEEYCSISRFRFFTSSRGIKELNASDQAATVYKVPMYGQAA